MDKLRRKDILFIVITLCVIGYVVYISCNYEVATEHKHYYFIASYIIFFPILIKLVYFNEENKKTGILKSLSNIGAVLLGPAFLALLIMQVISFHYTLVFGQEIKYLAKVYDREYKPGRRSSKHYVRFISPFGKEEIDDRETYDETDFGSILEIRKVKSVVGSYIKYDDIKVIRQ